MPRGRAGGQNPASTKQALPVQNILAVSTFNETVLHSVVSDLTSLRSAPRLTAEERIKVVHVLKANDKEQSNSTTNYQTVHRM